MAIAWSNLPIIDTLIDASTSATLRAGLDAAVLAAGWARTSSVTNGYVYRLTSPQGLKCKCLIQDQGGSLGLPYIVIQFLSDDELRAGRAYVLYIHSSREYRATVGICQFWLSLPDYSNDVDGTGNAGHSVCGGIPYIDPSQIPDELLEGECAVEVSNVYTTESWWSCASMLASLDTGNDICFRWSYKTNLTASSCHNGDLLIGSFGMPGAARLRLLPLADPLADSGSLPSRGHTEWAHPPGGFGDREGLYIDPFIAWGGSTFYPARLRGQIYDAMMYTVDRPLDHLLTTAEPGVGDVTWRNYSHFKGDMTQGSPHTYHMALYLCTGTPLAAPEPSNYVY